MMTRTMTAAAAAGFTACTFAMCVPAAATQTAQPVTKAQIEYGERASSLPTHSTKAQVEASEGAQRPTGEQQYQGPSSPAGSAGSDATAGQLALAAALGAAATGGGVLVSRQLSQHRHAVAQ